MAVTSSELQVLRLGSMMDGHMQQISVVASSITCQWRFAEVLPSLPAPGTPLFPQFWKTLKPFGLSAEGYSLETPTSRLSDVLLRLGLLNGRAQARLAYEWFEVSAEQPGMRMTSELVTISNKILSILSHSERSAAISARAHCALQGADVEEFLAAHVRSSQASAEPDFGSLIPDGFAYNLTGNKDKLLRLVISKSIVHYNSLFIEVNGEYALPLEPQALAVRFAKDSGRLLELVDLDILESSNDETDAEPLGSQ